jgi:ABC-2 type transport system ATP-binding protein
VTLRIEGLTKSFDSKTVLNDISFSVDRGEVFGLLGPNGAGKTTMILIILDILGPDSGRISIFGDRLSEAIKDRIGYLPEESDLYPNVTVRDCIRYFSRLKGFDATDERIDHWLQRMKLGEYGDKSVEELSKGMQRLLHIIISFIHEPDFLVLDEPFSGLDPVNKELVKDIVLDLKSRGMTIIMSTHQMDEVEKMCDRILMINKGDQVLYGNLNEIKGRHGSSIVVAYEGELPPLEDIERVNDYGNFAELIIGRGADPQAILRELVERVTIRKFEVKTPSLDEIFIEVVGNEE